MPQPDGAEQAGLRSHCEKIKDNEYVVELHEDFKARFRAASLIDYKLVKLDSEVQAGRVLNSNDKTPVSQMCAQLFDNIADCKKLQKKIYNVIEDKP